MKIVCDCGSEFEMETINIDQVEEGETLQDVHTVKIVGNCEVLADFFEFAVWCKDCNKIIRYEEE